ncbi:MAG: dicarboxylate/amino acid:cation symporter [Verrucomicrobiales bacterium]|nr:dicarboxylate/amino acid:cation symporter [Verrucomicrobiales bacterium]
MENGKQHPLELLHPRSLVNFRRQLQSLVEGRLWLKVLIGMVLGIGTGILLGPSSDLVSKEAARNIGNWLALPGQLFLASIQMIVIPLVFGSIIRGLAASETIEQLKSVGLTSVCFFLTTTTLAIVIGIGIALLIKPGAYVDADIARSALQAPQHTVPGETPFADKSIQEIIVDVIPQNPLGSMVNTEMLGVVAFAIVVGFALVSMDAKLSQPLLTLLYSIQEVCMTVVRWAMLLAPLAVFGMMAQLTSRLGIDALLGLSVYVVTVLAGLALMMVIYILLIPVLGGIHPWQFLKKARSVLLLAFSTSSSAAVMPMSIQTANDLGVRSSVSQFVIPLGATINMNGTALYQGVATIFLAQVFDVDLSIGQLVLVVITAVAASIGSPATPGVGIVILAMVLSTAGIPAAGIGLIIGVDRILDMSRTSVNVTGDLVAAAFVNRFIARGDKPEKIPEKLSEPGPTL